MQPILFEGFAEDCTITGRLTMFGERLSDFLNGQERFHIHHVVCNSLADGHEAAIDSLSVERSELLCVVATHRRSGLARTHELPAKLFENADYRKLVEVHGELLKQVGRPPFGSVLHSVFKVSLARETYTSVRPSALTDGASASSRFTPRSLHR